MRSSQEQVMTMSNNLSGLIFDVKRFAVHDGKGIRSTVFFKGCPLHCVWCQNPEGINSKCQILYLENKCIKCQSCKALSEHDGIVFKDEKLYINRDADEDWNKILDNCPTRALQYDSKVYKLDELMHEVLKDKVFFAREGGVTLSGGEPLLQFDFALALLKICKQEGLHTAIESSLFIDRERLSKILPYVDQIFADFKLFNPNLHKQYTNQDNQQIKANLQFILNSNYKDKLIVRTPLIPQITATKENITAISRFLSNCYADVHYELLNYNPLAKAKYNYLDLEYYVKENPAVYSSEQMAYFQRIAIQNGIKNLIKE